MNEQIDAIYDNGVLKPLVPLSLPDKSHVKLTIESRPEAAAAAKVASQIEALQQRWRELDQLPQTRNDDGWSVRQHDDLLYGKQR